MSYEQDYASAPIAQEDSMVRAQFIMRTYGHLIGAIAAFVGIEAVLLNSSLGFSILQSMMAMPWMMILGAFIVVSWIARSMAWNAKTRGMQYLALGGFVLAEAIIFLPMLAYAEMTAPGVISSAALISLMGFAGLTAVVWKMRGDFQFLHGALAFGGIMALVTIVAALIFGFELGTWFSVGMIVLAGMSILYDTSNIMLRYPADRHVSASLELFASVALLFWYVLRLMMSLQRD